MKAYTVFYAGLLYGEYDSGGWPSSHALPDGCYLRMSIGWWHHTGGTFQPIGFEEVPNELRAMVLLMQ